MDSATLSSDACQRSSPFGLVVRAVCGAEGGGFKRGLIAGSEPGCLSLLIFFDLATLGIRCVPPE